jgi:hypothetical protein
VEREPEVFCIDPDGVAADELAREDFLRQRIFELRLESLVSAGARRRPDRSQRCRAVRVAA